MTMVKIIRPCAVDGVYYAAADEIDVSDELAAKIVEQSAGVYMTVKADDDMTNALLQRLSSRDFELLNDSNGQKIAVKSSSILSNAKIGARNYLGNTANFQGWRFQKSGSETGTGYAQDGCLVFNSKTTHYSEFNITSNEGSSVTQSYAHPALNNIKTGKYIISFEAMSSVSNDSLRIALRQVFSDKTNIPVIKFVQGIDKNWKQFTVEIDVVDKATQAKPHDYWLFLFNTYTANAVVKIRKLQMEVGNIATDWRPAPEDCEASVAKLETRINALSDTI